MNKLNKVVTILAKIGEIGHWVACGLLIVMTIAVTAGKDALIYQLSSLEPGTVQMEINGFSIDGMNGGAITPGVYIIFFITGIISCGLLAMVFRNIYLIFKTTAGQTKFSEGATPFQTANVRMIREIGIFCIAIPVVELIMSVITGIAFGGVESSVQFYGLVLGLVVLCLSRFFSYGVELQKETEGLV